MLELKHPRLNKRHSDKVKIMFNVVLILEEKRGLHCANLMATLKNDPLDSMSNVWKIQLCKWPVAFWMRNNEQGAHLASI